MNTLQKNVSAVFIVFSLIIGFGSTVQANEASDPQVAQHDLATLQEYSREEAYPGQVVYIAHLTYLRRSSPSIHVSEIVGFLKAWDSRTESDNHAIAQAEEVLLQIDSDLASERAKLRFYQRNNSKIRELKRLRSNEIQRLKDLELDLQFALSELEGNCFGKALWD